MGSGSFAQGSSSKIPAPALTLLFGYCTKIKLFKGLGCLRLCSGNPGVKLVSKPSLTMWCSCQGHQSQCDCQSGFWVVGHGSLPNS